MTFSLVHDENKSVECHSYDRNKTYNCYICGTTFFQKVVMERHFEEVHNGQKPHKCPQCEECFTEIASVQRHISSVHEGRIGNFQQVENSCYTECERKWSPF